MPQPSPPLRGGEYPELNFSPIHSHLHKNAATVVVSNNEADYECKSTYRSLQLRTIAAELFEDWCGISLWRSPSCRMSVSEGSVFRTTRMPAHWNVSGGRTRLRTITCCCVGVRWSLWIRGPAT